MQPQIERRIPTPRELHELAAEGGAERTLLQQAERFPEVAIAAGVDIDHRRLQVGDLNRAAAYRQPADAPRTELRAQTAVLEEHSSRGGAQRRKAGKIVERDVARVERDPHLAAAVAEREALDRACDVHDAVRGGAS